MENIRGATLMVLAMLGFAIEDMFVKKVSALLPVGQILFLLGAGGAVIFGIACIMQGRSPFSRAMWNWPIMIRAAGEIIGTLGFVSALALTPLSSASAILQATPLAVTLGAAIFLKEPVGWRRWSAIAVGFIGVLLIVQPGTDGFTPLSFLALIGVVGLSMRDLATRRAPDTVSTMQLSFLGFAAIVPAGPLFSMAMGVPFVPLEGPAGLWLVIALTFGVVSYYAIVAAMRVGEVSFVTPFRYTRLIFALILSVSILGERPNNLTLIGAAIIVASGIYTLLRERKQRVNPISGLPKPPVQG